MNSNQMPAANYGTLTRQKPVGPCDARAMPRDIISHGAAGAGRSDGAGRLPGRIRELGLILKDVGTSGDALESDGATALKTHARDPRSHRRRSEIFECDPVEDCIVVSVSRCGDGCAQKREAGLRSGLLMETAAIMAWRRGRTSGHPLSSGRW